MKKEKNYNKISGWLILVVFGYIYSIIVNVGILSDTYKIYLDGTMSVLSDPASEHYNKGLFYLVNYEFVIAIIIIIAVCIGLVIMFQKKKTYPKYAIFLLIFSNLLVISDAILCNIANIEISADEYTTLGRQISSAIIWIVYFLRSVRVKETFVN